MINEEIRSILEPELQDGEELIWAEKTNHDAQRIHKKWFLLTPARRRSLIAIWVLGLIALLITFNLPPGIDNWGALNQRLNFHFFGGVAIYAFVIPIVLFILNMIVKGRVYNIGAYALTNKRLFELDYELKIIKYIDASRVKQVTGSEGVRLKPIGAKGSKSYQLGLMNNSTLTINYLHAKITKARSAAQ